MKQKNKLDSSKMPSGVYKVSEETTLYFYDKDYPERFMSSYNNKKVHAEFPKTIVLQNEEFTVTWNEKKKLLVKEVNSGTGNPKYDLNAKYYTLIIRGKIYECSRVVSDNNQPWVVQYDQLSNVKIKKSLELRRPVQFVFNGYCIRITKEF